jgi:hypothetical protein
LLSALNINLAEIIEERDYDSTALMEIWDFQCPENENLEIVQVYLESVHGILTRCHFTDLVQAVRRNHPTLLETVTLILNQRYGAYRLNSGVLRHDNTHRRQLNRWIGVQLAPALKKATIRYVL